MDIQTVIASTDEAWVDYEDSDDGEKFLLAYSESKGPVKFRQNQQNRLRKAARGGFIPQEQIEEMTFELLVKHIVKGWEKLTDKGKDFPYSPENCRHLLKVSPTIRDWVAAQSAEVRNFNREVMGETAVGAIKSAPDLEP